MGPSAVYVTLATSASPYAGGMTTGVFNPSMLNRGSYLPAPQDRYTFRAASGTAGEAAIIRPGSRSRFGHPSSRCPNDGANESSTVEWQMEQAIPTRVNVCTPPTFLTVPTIPTTASSLIRATVVAGSVRSTCPLVIAVMTLSGRASTSIFNPRPRAVFGSSVDSMT
jgi:hypothetical protein